MPVQRLSPRDHYEPYEPYDLTLLNQPAPSRNLNDMTKAQLLDYANENGVDGVSGAMKKADIIATIEEGGK